MGLRQRFMDHFMPQCMKSCRNLATTKPTYMFYQPLSNCARRQTAGPALELALRVCLVCCACLDFCQVLCRKGAECPTPHTSSAGQRGVLCRVPFATISYVLRLSSLTYPLRSGLSRSPIKMT